jgi:uncharacterized protein (TIGR02300 family)
VGKVDLGMKLTCSSCGARFYDLNKTPGSCPKCGADNARPVVFRTTRRPAAEEKKPVAAVVVNEVADDVVDDAVAGKDDDEDDAVIEDTSDLGEDEDVEVVVEEKE